MSHFGWLLVAVAVGHCPADELTLDARRLMGRGVTHHVRLSDDGSAIELGRGVLIEDDGPAAGFSYRPNEEKLFDQVRVRKQLFVPDPRARAATLLVGGAGSWQASLNGQALTLRDARKAGNYWEAYAIAPDRLQRDANDFILWGSGKLWIARDDEYATGSLERKTHPNRSAKSRDGGATWDDARLGTGDNLDGEYYVRLFLDQFQPAGSITSDVLDLGNLAEQVIAPPITALGRVTIRVEGEPGEAGSMTVRVRSGIGRNPADASWSGWETLTGTAAVLRQVRGRFFQVAIDLSTTNALNSPRVTRLVVAAQPQRGDAWTERVKVLEHDRAEVVRTSIPFQYERFDQPQLSEFRRRFKLDDVVAGTATEFELIARLAAWSARQWQKGHLAELYPPWNAGEILQVHRDGKPLGGFCQQYNVVFLQACESFGLCGRAVSLGPGDHGLKIRGGHEVVEIWSNEYRKWVYVDGNMAWYFVDDASRIPLSLSELRQRQLEAAGASGDQRAARGTSVIHVGEPRQQWQGLDSWPPFAELRLIPRSNFLGARAPLPLNQGMRGWFWTGHHVWTDAQSPAAPLYGHRVDNARNWNWTLNQASVYLVGVEKAGELDVHLDTETPGFAEFRATLDDQQARAVPGVFRWKLHPGVNALSVVSRNRAGRDGSQSSVRVAWP